MLPFLCCTVCKVWMGPDWRCSEMFICVLCLKFAFCRELILRTFLCDGTCKPLLTSKPSLTIALKISKTIEKPSKPMVGPSKNIQWWWSNGIKTIEKPLKSMVAWKKTLTIPSLWKIDHRRGLSRQRSWSWNSFFQAWGPSWRTSWASLRHVQQRRRYFGLIYKFSEVI